MTENLVQVTSLEGGISILTLNRPEKRNALNIPLLKAFCQSIESLKDIRVLILNGAGPIFCSGLDLVEAQDQSLEEASAELIAHALLLLSKAHFVTIAAVEGAALAGGAGIMAACDIVIAGNEAKIGFPEVLRGLVPAQIASILSRQVGWRALRELLLTGSLIDAKKAKEIGLINQIVATGAVLEQARQVAKSLMKGAPESIRLTKMLLDELNPSKIEGSLLKSISLHHVSRHSAEAEEGIKAFLEKREPFWVK